MSIELDEQATEARRQYYREYYQANRERIREQQNAWRNKHPEKIKGYAQSFWDKRAKAMEQEQS